ncbi:Ethyl tert-butyl ether degradation [Lasiodiplodia theobromae]|uniref:Ethyl tert-butyl ether degradation n=1 Tax=Lasiodiplodia theobromae TaxID=45133 RepID=UPI0015C3B0BE|nr:Ethyl tert-butyl ether degradation [Lasiodiplodia theobromae]KAF4536472.1 Ethyl tert-butyl ether degradation [Lasiodiplodia theobromae]
MAVTSTILYPNTPGKNFDLKYYLNTHMPLTEKIWGPLGLTSWRVVEFKAGADGGPPPYRLKTETMWESREKLDAAVTNEQTSAIFGDVANFTDETWIEIRYQFQYLRSPAEGSLCSFEDEVLEFISMPA